MTSVTHYLTASDELVRKDQWDEQLALMREALEHFPDHPEFCLRYALSVSTHSPEEATDYARRASEKAHFDPAVQVRCASLFVTLKQFADAKLCIERAAPFVDDNFPFIADMFHVIGLLGRENGTYDIAERYLRLAFEVEPNGSDHAVVYADFLIDYGHTERALDVIARRLEHASHDRELLLKMREEIMKAD